jgi:hypothetical protein
MKKPNTSRTVQGGKLAGIKYAEGRGAVEFEPTDSASDKAPRCGIGCGARQDHHADARGAGG